MIQIIVLLSMVSMLLTGCSVRQAGYTAVGAGVGGTAGYFIHRDKKEAAIGALGGALVGNIAAQIQDSNQKKKQKADYDNGYRQAELDLANKNWDEGTGKMTYEQSSLTKRLETFKVPRREQDGVVYDQHYITLEVDL